MQPLAGITIIEFAGIGPAPFCGMMLADHGATVIRIERPGTPPSRDPLLRGRVPRALDLKQPAGLAAVLELLESADGLIEGFRPGVMERLGLGPDVVHARNPRLVYGRMTGWGQSGPLAHTAGHDIDYVALSGTLHTIGRAGERAVPPVNYLGDFGGGGMMLAFGMAAGLLAARTRGRGCVIDAAMVDGAALLAAMTWGFKAAGLWADARGRNALDGGAHYYDTYTCADDRDIAVGAIEAPFYAALRAKLGIADDPAFDAQHDPSAWPALKAKLAAIFRTQPRDHWTALFEGGDACVAPVLSLAEAPLHPHNVARGVFLEVDGVVQPGAAPRFSALRA